MCRKMIYFIPTIGVTFAILVICGMRMSVSLKQNVGHDEYVALFRCCLDDECNLAEFLRLCRAFGVDDVCLYHLADTGVGVGFLVNDEFYVVLRTGELLKFKNKRLFERMYNPIKLFMLYCRGDVFLRNEDVFIHWRKNEIDCRTLIKGEKHDLHL